MGGKCLLVIAVAVAAGVLPTRAADGRKPQDPCRPKHATTLFANDAIRFFYVSWPDGRSEYLCARSSRRRFFLTYSATPENDNDVTDFRANGRFFLYATNQCTKAFCNPGKVGLIDVTSGARRKLPVPQPAAMELTSTGTVAYTTEPPVGISEPRAVYVLPRSAAQPQQLDAGDDLDAQSLALAGHTLYWTRGGQPQSAQIP
jgi:hypothetical protein